NRPARNSNSSVSAVGGSGHICHNLTHCTIGLTGATGGGIGAMALILLIDDDGFYRRLIEQALNDEGHQVVSAENGAEGIAAYRERRPDLVITDMRMPGMGGGEVIRALRNFDARAKIIAVSGAPTFYDGDLFQLASEAGADAIIRKLDPLERVAIEVSTLLGGAVEQPPA